jgi:hypothetical protein
MYMICWDDAPPPPHKAIGARIQEWKERVLILMMEEAAGVEDGHMWPRAPQIQALNNLIRKYEALALTKAHEQGSI